MPSSVSKHQYFLLWDFIVLLSAGGRVVSDDNNNAQGGWQALYSTRYLQANMHQRFHTPREARYANGNTQQFRAVHIKGPTYCVTH